MQDQGAALDKDPLVLKAEWQGARAKPCSQWCLGTMQPSGSPFPLCPEPLPTVASTPG